MQKKFYDFIRGEELIVGIGCDVLHIDRVDKLLTYKKFLYKYFTENEIKMFNENFGNRKNYIKKIASNLSVKEAFYKAVSKEIYFLKFTDVEVLRNKEGRPYIKLYNELEKFNMGYNVNVTISNEVNIVTSFVILEKIN